MKINEIVDVIISNKNSFIYNIIYNLEDRLELSPSYDWYEFEAKINEIEFNNKKYNSISFCGEGLVLIPREKGEPPISLLDVLKCKDKPILVKIVGGIKKLFKVANIGDEFEDTVKYTICYSKCIS